MDAVFHPWNSARMIDLNALRVFEKVATLLSFSAAARALGSPKSSVSRSVAALEAGLGTRLLQRTTHTVVLTASGTALRDRCADVLVRADEMVDYVSSFGKTPRGALRICAGIGFGINVLSELLPEFLLRYPNVLVSLDLSGQLVDLVAASVDVAIRIGPLPSSGLVARKLGTMNRYLCAAPSYLARQATPRQVADLRHHDALELPSADGRPRTWSFTGPGGEVRTVEPRVRVAVNEALTLHRLVRGGAGIGCLSAYICGPDVDSGALVPLLAEWKLPPLEVSAVFPSNRELAPAVRAFVDFMSAASGPGSAWRSDPLRKRPGRAVVRASPKERETSAARSRP